jgi:hypothetical protein
VNLATIKAALKVAAIAASGLSSAGAVEWKGQAVSSSFRPFIRCDMSLRSFVGIGNDEVRKTYDDDTDALLLNVAGNRTAVWTLRFETQDGSDSGEAANYALRTMARLQRASVREDLLVADIARSGFQPIQTFDNVKVQDRLISVAVLEVNLNLVENDTDDVSSGDYIATVEVETDTLDNEAGDPVASQINLIVGPV